jgi:hypothetical protein
MKFSQKAEELFETLLILFNSKILTRKSILLLLICMQSIYAIIKMVSEKTGFLALLKN